MSTPEIYHERDDSRTVHPVLIFIIAVVIYVLIKEILAIGGESCEEGDSPNPKVKTLILFLLFKTNQRMLKIISNNFQRNVYLYN